ncbi:MAG: Gfo/Idh/MocA family protein [Kiritimatiellia bacterium]
MVRIALVGFGFMGRMHYGGWKRIPGANVVAVCDANLKQLTTVSGGNLPGVDATTDFTGVAVFDDYAALLAAGGFDAVDITLPTALHPATAIAALEAGFHVLCEKPMALSVRDCDAMLAAAGKARRTLLIAQCLRFWPEYVALKRIVASGRYGAVVAADFQRSSNAPDPRGPHGWFLDERKSGGCLLDMHIHDADMVAWLFGPPASASAWVHRRADGVLDHAQLRYAYPDKIVTATVSWAVAKTLGFEASFRVVFEKATVVMDGRRERPFMVYPDRGRPFAPKVPKRSAYEAEQRYFLDLVRGRADGSVLSARDARDAVARIENAVRIVAHGCKPGENSVE